MLPDNFITLCKQIFICKNPIRSFLRKKVSALAKPSRKQAFAPALSFDFNQVARKAVHDHPEVKKDILFVDATNDNLIATAATMAKLEDDDDAQDELRKTVKLAKRLQTSFAQSIMIDSKKTIHAIVFHPDRHPLFDPQDRIIDAIGTIDHELGHVLCPDADRLMGENVADAYAVLRHLQRFDGQPTDIGYAAWKRAMTFIMAGHTSHLTTFTIDRILLDSRAADFVSLTPAQTVAIARDYARKHTPSPNVISKLSNDFKNARSKRLDDKLFREIARVTLAAKTSSDTFYLGAAALLPVLQAGRMTLNAKTVTLQGREWTALQQQLESRIADLPKRHAAHGLIK